MAKEVARLKDESEMLKQKIRSDNPQTMSPSARNSRIIALENMLATSSTTLVTMASQLSEAAERERMFSGRGRWNQVRSLAEAKNLMNYLFNLASSSRCQLRDKELNCREKDSVISELKEKVVSLNSLLRQKEAQMAEMRDQELQKIASMKSSKGPAGSLGSHISNHGDDVCGYTLRKASRTSQVFHQSRSNVDWLDDMDISDSEPSDISETESDFGDEDWVDSNKKNGKRRSVACFTKVNPDVPHSRKSLKLEIPNGETPANVQKNDIEGCCSCSTKSSCKTKKCECRAAGGICGSSCGCVPSRCANRGGCFIKKETDIASNPDNGESGGSHSSIDSMEDEKSKELVVHGAMLLQSALGESPSVENQHAQPESGRQRKPLSDIGNTSNNPNIPKPPRRKNWRKSAIQLVPAPHTPLPDDDVPKERDDVPLRLPRAMERNPPLVERNSMGNNESTGNNNKDSRGLALPRPPLQFSKASEEKENHRIQ